MDSGAVSQTNRGWCEWCIHAFNNLRPLEHISDTHAFGISVDRTVEEIRTSADAGCQLCAMIYFNMKEASSSDQEQLQNKSMLVKMWHDTSKDFFTGDQLDEYRFDVICENRKTSLQLTNLPHILSSVLADIANARSEDNNTGSDYATAMIGYWLRECIHHHPKCRGTIERLPTRVLDVGEEGDSQEPFLFVSEGKTAPYIAMSHCWGKSPMATTTQENLQNRLKAITLSELPKSFRDAIQTCRKLGVRYLWIDSLCIIQNSTKDWQQEASRMGSVYKNAILTIAAVSAKDSTEGCFMSRDAGKMRPCWSLMTGDTSMEDSSKYLWIRPQRDALSIVYLQLRHMGGPLDSRAWVLQEKILARRTVYYHKDMLYFECPTMEASEQVPEGICGDLWKSMGYHSRLQEAIHGKANLSDKKVVDQLYSAWYRCMMEFTGRQMTMEGDRLFALTGLANEMQNVLDQAYETHSGLNQPDAYIAGVWHRELWRGLLWSVMSGTSISHSDNKGSKRQCKPLAPTWSWASVTGFVSYLNGGQVLKDLEYDRPDDHITWRWEVLCTIMDVASLPDNPAQFNQDRDGRLEIRGPVKTIVLKGDTAFDPATGEEVGDFCRDLEHWEIKPVACLAIGKQQSKIWALLLEPVPRQQDTYRRVGLTRVEKVEWFDDAPTVTICVL